MEENGKGKNPIFEPLGILELVFFEEFQIFYFFFKLTISIDHRINVIYQARFDVKCCFRKFTRDTKISRYLTEAENFEKFEFLTAMLKIINCQNAYPFQI